MAPRCMALARFGWQCLLLGLLMLIAATGVRAQNIESVLRPGDVIRGHAKWEDDCSKCHLKFDRSAQDRLCMDCHKDVGQDLRARIGHHGRLKPQACRSCHTDHKGRDAVIAPLDKKQFDHTQTDYVLRGAHQKVECDKCHVAPRKYRDAPQDCLSCHRKDDVHKGSLGAKCADCHTENKWTEARFDHDKTRFALKNRHADVKCVDCHQNGRYKDTPRNCLACHKKDDQGVKGHRGQFGERCDSCHDDKGWKPSTFNHDTDTKYVLRGKHRTTRCADCHSGNLYRDKVGTACVDCHVKDDKHKGSLGKDCGACHTERDWKEQAKFDHDKTRFPLLGKHRDTKCTACHKSANYKDVGSDCLSCHKKDDKHEGTLGAKCGDCHHERDWQQAPKFEHDKTRFRLRNAHAAAKVKCVDCHANPRRFRDTAMECVACHQKDDKHEGTQGDKCHQCHDDRNWKTTRFDHRLTRFPLLGRHVVVQCDACHKSKRYKDAPSDCYSCHQADDRHKLKYGTACESCHNARGWGLWDFDHARRTRFLLDGKHSKISCDACHSRPAPAGQKIAAVDTACVACHKRDDTHDGAFGAACERCHSTDGWKRIRQRVSAVLPPAEKIASLYGAASYFARGSGSLGGPR